MSEEETKPLLSKREIEVLEIAASGASNQKIAEKLFISTNTVRKHLSNISKKLDVQSRTEAVSHGIQLGWIRAPGSAVPIPERKTSPESTSSEIPTDDKFTVAVNSTSESSVQPIFMPIPSLALWQKIYFLLAFGIALFVLSTPLIKATIEAEARRPPDFEGDISAIPTNTPTSSAREDTSWEIVTEMATGKSRLATVAYENKLYLIGGQDESGITAQVAIFDPKTETWQQGQDKPTPAIDIQGLVLDDKAYIPGGCTLDEVSNRLEIYHPITDTWTSGTNLPEALCAYAAVVYRKQIYVIGGWDGKDYVNSFYVYHTKEDRWSILEQAYPINLGYAGAVVVGEKLYVVGGYDGKDEFAQTTIYDFQRQDWQWGPTLTVARGGLGLVAIGDTLYAMGGGWIGNDLTSSGERLTLSIGIWEPIEPAPIGQWRNFGLSKIENIIFIVGGETGENQLKNIMTYHPTFKVYMPLTQ